MPNELPYDLKQWRLSFDGSPLSTKVKDLTLPTLERETEEYQGGGMLAPVKLHRKYKALSISFTAAEECEEVMDTWGDTSVAQRSLRFTGLNISDSTGERRVIEIEVRGRISKMELGKAEGKGGKDTPYEFDVSYLKRTQNGKVTLEIDVVSGDEFSAGVDLGAIWKSMIGGA